jgi:hydrogenase-4 component B
MLTALATVVAALMVLGLVGCVRRDVAAIGMAALCSVAGALAIASIIIGGRTILMLPAGLPDTGLTLALDPLSAFFLLPVCIACAAAGLSAAAEPPVTAPLLPIFAGSMLLTLLAGDTGTLMLGFTLMAAAGWGLIQTRHEEAAAAAASFAGMIVAGSACLLTALALLPGAGFEAMRATPPDGWRAAAVLLLVLAGAGPAAGLAPLHLWLPRAHAVSPGPVCALLSGGMAKVAVYAIVRVLFDLCGPATPAWWCAPLLAMGAASAILGGLRANREPALQPVLAGAAIQHAGFIAIGLGVALAARGADLPTLASLALGGAMLHALNHGVFQTLATLSAAAAEHGAATRMLDRLGGLIHGMPVTTACMLVASASLACLPLTAGFASLWVLLQTVLAAPRIGGLALQTALALVAAALAMATALGAAGSVRLVGIAFLGRPRSPRAAAAEEAPALTRAVLIGLAGLNLLLGLLPGAALALTDGARQMLSATRLREQADWAGIEAQADMPGYAPLGVALLAGMAGLGLWLLVRRMGLAAPRRVPPWAGGFAASPPWLPFGDPATQYTAESLGTPVTRMLGDEQPDGWTGRAATWFGRPATAAVTWLTRCAGQFGALAAHWLLAILLALLLAGLVSAAWLEGA